MLKRGVKRKNPDDEMDEYARNLSNFQIKARNRESMRLKNQVLNTEALGVPGLLEKQLKDKVAVEMSLMEGTAKFIMACKNTSQTLEAAKTLLIARMRSDMLKFELNKLRRGRGSPQMKQGKPSYAELSLSDIRIPLMWRRKSKVLEKVLDHINDVGDPRRFAVFCVAKIGSQIYDSSLIEPVDRHHTDLTFPDVILFNKVPPYFELTLEVYAHCLEKEHQGITSTPQKIARSISKAVGKSLIAKNMRDFENIGPKFELIASATLTLDSCSEGIHTQEFYVEDSSSEWSIPLFGHFCYRLAGLPYCCDSDVISGAITLTREGKNQAPKSFFARLINWKLQLWTDKSLLLSNRSPYLTIPVNRGTSIEDKDDMLIVSNEMDAKHIFVFEDKENLHFWLIHMIQHAADHRRWKQLAEKRMEVYQAHEEKSSANHAFGRAMKRTRSKLMLLYNETGN